jgi:serine/threonine-protein kinase
VAEGIALDADDPTKADKSGVTVEKHLIDGQWVSKPSEERLNYDECAFEDGKRVPGSDTESVSSSWHPQPDGTFRGMWTETVLTDECHLQGRVTQAPIVATRVADVPDGIAIPAPAAGPPPPTPALPAPGQPLLEGTYRLDYDTANEKVNGVVTPGNSPLKTEWWAFRSLCRSMGCVATAVELDPDNNQVPTATADVLHFTGGQWHSRPEVALVPTCTVTRNGVTGPEQYPEDHMDKTWTPQPDGSLRGVNTLSVATNECGQQGRVHEFPFIATRIGAVPTSTVVADPGLFVS